MTVTIKPSQAPSKIVLSTGLRSFISWERLVTKLREAGEISDSEDVTHLEVSDGGIMYCVEQRSA